MSLLNQDLKPCQAWSSNGDRMALPLDYNLYRIHHVFRRDPLVSDFLLANLNCNDTKVPINGGYFVVIYIYIYINHPD